MPDKPLDERIQDVLEKATERMILLSNQAQYISLQDEFGSEALADVIARAVECCNRTVYQLIKETERA